MDTLYFGDTANGNLKKKPRGDELKLGGIFGFKCYDKNGNLKWEEKAKNTVVNEGLDYVLGLLLKGALQSDPWYIGLMNGTPAVAAGDTTTTHAGWTEVTAYTEGARQEFVDGAIATHSIDNSGTVATFSINANGTVVGGAFLADSSSTGANGTLLSAAAFTGGDKTADNGDTIEVTYTFSASSV